MHSAYKLNKQGDNIQPWSTPFLIWNQSVVPCPVLTCFWTCKQISQEAGEVIWHFQFFQNFLQYFVICKDFGIVTKSKVDVFLELSRFFNDPTDIGNLIPDSSAIYKSRNIWKSMVHISLKPSLQNFEHCFASVWDECNCVVVWTFFGIGMKTDLFQSCSHCWVFKFAVTLSATLSQHHLLGFERAQLEFHRLH